MAANGQHQALSHKPTQQGNKSRCGSNKSKVVERDVKDENIGIDGTRAQSDVAGRVEPGMKKISSRSASQELVVMWKKLCVKVEKQFKYWVKSKDPSSLASLQHTLQELQTTSKDLICTDVEACLKLEAVNRLWKQGHYPVVEALRRSEEPVLELLSDFLQSCDRYYSALLESLQSSGGFTLTDYLNGRIKFPSKTRQRLVLICVSLCQQCLLVLGDLSRYTQHSSSSPNWGKPRMHYLKAKDLGPKNGRPYNQLAVVALNSNHRLDAVYYYMRSLMAKNPIKSAHDSLVALFTDTSTKVQRQEDQEQQVKMKAEKAAARKLRKQQKKSKRKRPESNNEVWIIPGAEDKPLEQASIQVPSLPTQDTSVSHSELLKKLTSLFLLAHGTLFTKIGIERIECTLVKLMDTLSLAIKHSPGTYAQLPHKLVQMMTINMFSIHNAQEVHVDNATSEGVYCGLGVRLSLQMTTVLLRHCSEMVGTCKHSVGDSEECVDTLSVLLPSVRVWLKWLDLQTTKWTQWLESINNQTMYEFWSICCLFLNNCHNHYPGLLASSSSVYWEDRMLSGLAPLGLSDCLNITDITNLPTTALKAQVVPRIAHISQLTQDLTTKTGYGLVLGSEYRISEQVSDLIKGTPTPVAGNIEESDSSDDVMECSSSEDSESEEPSAEIKQLKAERERLTQKVKDNVQAIQSAEAVLNEATKSKPTTKTITPRYLIPDTNCFVDMLDSIQKLVSHPGFTIAVPLVVLSELEGLSKGSTDNTKPLVTSGAKSAVDYLLGSIQSRVVKALTTQGSLLTTLSFRAELTDMASNDDLILTSCLQLHAKVDSGDRHSVVLLTDDRNLRVKAHVNNLPVKDMPGFMTLLSQ